MKLRKSLLFSWMLLCITVLFPSLYVEATEGNTTIKGSIYNGKTAISKGIINIRNVDDEMFNNISVKNGSFSVKLPDGIYFIQDFEDYAKKKKGTVNYRFIVRQGQLKSPLRVVINENVKGTLKPLTTKVKSGVIEFKSDNYEVFWTSISNNNFSMDLPDGNYMAKGFYNDSTKKYSNLDYKMTVQDGKAKVSKISIAEKKPIVNGSVVYGKNRNGNGHFTVYKGDKAFYIFNIEIKNGKISSYLPDGIYKYNALTIDGVDYAVYGSKFIVKSGKTTNLKLELPESNIQGTVKGYTKGIDSVIIEKLNSKGNVDYNYTPLVNIVKGTFKTFLPDGEYIIRNGYLKSPYYISVKNGKANKSIVLDFSNPYPNLNISGDVSYDQLPVLSGFLILSSKDGKSYYAGIKLGSFELYLPDGEYKTQEFSDEEYHQMRDIHYSFTVKDGKLTHPLSLKVEKDNVFGKIEIGSTFSVNGSISISPTNNNNNEEYGIDNYFVEVKNGKFSSYLSDGEYTIESYNSDTVMRVLNYKITITNGKLAEPLFLKLEEDNVFGKIQKGTTLIKYGTIGITSANDNKVNYDVYVKEGKFSSYLPDGEYIIKDFNNYETGKRVLNYRFSVTNGKLSAPIFLNIEDNVLGKIEIGSSPWKNGSISISSTNDNKLNCNVKEGEFSTYLPDGEYTIQSLYNRDTGKSFSSNQRFVVLNGKLSVPLIVADNVRGKIEIGSTPLENGTIYMFSGDHFLYSADVKEGNFSSYLPDGEYTVDSLFNSDTGKSRMSGQKFTVINGKLSSPLFLKLNEENVFGKIEIGSTLLKNGEIWISSPDDYKVNESVEVKEGEFSLYLPDGEYSIYALLNLDTNQFLYLKQKFTVTNGKVTEQLSLKLE